MIQATRSPPLPSALGGLVAGPDGFALARELTRLRGSIPRSLALRGLWLGGLLLVAGLAVRAIEARGALLYPDGYQYLLMARGIAQHLRPVVGLGRGGELFVPNADAALKPLFPALIALLHTAGASWSGAARGISVASGAASCALAGVLAGRLSGSRLLGTAAGLLVIFDPVARYWAAFSSPDELGQALMLGAVLAVLARRPASAGLLAGLTIFARPELGLLLVAAGLVLAFRPTERPEALRFLAAAFATAATLLALLRPPIVLAPGTTALACAGALAAAALALLLPARFAVATGIAVLAGCAVRFPALSHLALHEPWLSGACVAGLLLARRTRAAAVLAVALAALAIAYDTRNGTSSRYLVELLPLAAAAAALGAAQAAGRGGRRAAGAAALTAVALAASAAAAPAPGPDTFTTIAGELPRSGTPLLTAAPDAYGYLLFPRPVRALVPGARGLLLFDASARAYEPGLSYTGRLVARLAGGDGFADPSGHVDRAPALLVRGRVVESGQEAR